MKKLYFLLFTFISFASFGQIINEFQPNAAGADPDPMPIELKGTPSASFSGFLISVESDGANGLVDRSAAVSGTFDANGLLVVNIPDLENPSFTFILCSLDPGIGTDLDGDNDGTIDNPSILGTTYDAIGIPDNDPDAIITAGYATQLGGVSFAYTGDEPGLVFRDGATDDWYALNEPFDGTSVYDISANIVQASDFSPAVALAGNFGTANPIYTAPTGPNIVTMGTVGDLDYFEGSGPSAEDSFTAEATDLGADLIIVAPTNFEISLTSGSGFTGSINISPDMSGAVATTTIYVRLEDGLIVGNYTGDITLNSTGATERTVSLNGNVVALSSCNETIGSLIITEIMQNPNTISDNDGEYFEVYNTTGASIDMNGMDVVDLTNGGESFTIASSVVVPANGYVVLGINGDTMVNGGITLDYDYPDTFFLGNGSDEISLQCNGTVIDEVLWDNGATFPDPNGSSMELSVTALNSVDNDNGANWGEATTAYDPNNNGTPGTANDFSLSTTNIENVEFSFYPNPTNTGNVTISSSTSEAIDIQVFDVLGKQVINQRLTNNNLNVSNLKSGLYIVRITQNNASVTKKLVIK